MLSWRCLILSLCLVSAPTAFAESTFVDGVGVVILAGEPFKVGIPWSDEAKESLIGGSGNIFLSTIGVVMDSPFTSWIYFPINNAGNFQKMGDIIASHCKANFPEDPMRAISCVAQSVNATLKKTSWPDWFSFCRAHATAFRTAIKKLGIPRSAVMDVDASTTIGGHVVSRLTLTTRTGMPYSYIIDVGNRPGTVFPNTPFTEEWHLKHTKQFPEFSFEEPVYNFQSKDNQD